MEIFLQYRKARGCSKEALQRCRGLFVCLNVGVYLVYCAVELLKLIIFDHSSTLYLYEISRANTLLTSVLLLISVLEVSLSGVVAIRVISSLLPERIRKVKAHLDPPHPVHCSPRLPVPRSNRLHPNSPAQVFQLLGEPQGLRVILAGLLHAARGAASGDAGVCGGRAGGSEQAGQVQLDLHAGGCVFGVL